MFNLLELPDLPLLHVLSCLDYETVKNVASVCQKLRSFVNLEKIWIELLKREDRLFSSSCSLKSCCKHQCHDLHSRQKYFITRRISCEDCGRRRVMKRFRKKSETMKKSDPRGEEKYKEPHLSKCGSKVWISYGKQLKKLQFADIHDCNEPMSETSYAGLQSEIRQIAHWNDFVTACCSNGQLLVWNSEKPEAPIDCHQVSRAPLLSCDFDERTIAVGSRDKELTVYQMDADSKTRRAWLTDVAKHPYKVALRPCDAKKLFVASFATDGGNDVSEQYDIHSGAVDYQLQFADNDKRLSAVHWESFSTLITVGCHVVRIWDMRTNSCVTQHWDMNPYHFLTAVRGDGSNAVVIGGLPEFIHVLDRRRFKDPVRSWKTEGKVKDKVIDLAVDMTHFCYTLWDSINAIDFNY